MCLLVVVVVVVVIHLLFCPRIGVGEDSKGGSGGGDSSFVLSKNRGW